MEVDITEFRVYVAAPRLVRYRVLFGSFFHVLQLLPIISQFHDGILVFALANLRRSINTIQIENRTSHGLVMVIGSVCLLIS